MTGLAVGFEQNTAVAIAHVPALPSRTPPRNPRLPSGLKQELRAFQRAFVASQKIHPGGNVTALSSPQELIIEMTDRPTDQSSG